MKEMHGRKRLIKIEYLINSNAYDMKKKCSLCIELCPEWLAWGFVPFLGGSHYICQGQCLSISTLCWQSRLVTMGGLKG